MKLPEPYLYYADSETFTAEAVREIFADDAGLDKLYSEAQVIVTFEPVLKQALESLNDTCGNRCNAEYNPCHAREAADAIRKLLNEPQSPHTAR